MDSPFKFFFKIRQTFKNYNLNYYRRVNGDTKYIIYAWKM